MAKDVKKYPHWSIKSVQRDPILQEALDHLDGMSPMQIERKCGVTASTIRSWRSGKTRRPQNLTLTFALRAAGFKRVIVPDGR